MLPQPAGEGQGGGERDREQAGDVDAAGAASGRGRLPRRGGAVQRSLRHPQLGLPPRPLPVQPDMRNVQGGPAAAEARAVDVPRAAGHAAAQDGGR
eukprot:8799579-Pyramimonas_sp.AAC.1